MTRTRMTARRRVASLALAGLATTLWTGGGLGCDAAGTSGAAAADTAADAGWDAAAELGPVTFTDTAVDTHPDTGPVADTAADPDTDVDTPADTAADTAADPDTDVDTLADTLADTDAATDADVDALADPDTPTDAAADTATDAASDTDVAPDTDTSPTACPAGVICVDTFPFTHEGDTTQAPFDAFDVYPCKPSADESGPEYVYRVTVPEDGFLSVAVYDDAPGEDPADVDVDVHILAEDDPETCITRGHHDAAADVEAGTVWVVVDTWVDSDLVEYAGAFRVDIGFLAPSVGPCDMEVGVMHRVGDGGDALAMPATGPMVKEAHLVTQDEPPPYPETSTDHLAQHYALSQSVTGLVMYRQEPWAPLEGGSFYGAGIGSPADFPTLDEGWYVNMYWTAQSRPPKGTKMILRLPGADRAVVVAAGYETGPGDLSNIGGTPEETHFYLGTKHHDVMTLGVAVDQAIPLGPRWCL